MWNYWKSNRDGFGKWTFDFEKKEVNSDIYIRYMLSRTNTLFDYTGLPDTIPARNLELMLQTNGNVCITEVNGDLYAFTGGLGGKPDPYYMPTQYIVANPALAFTKTLTINEECIVIPSDSLYMGLIPMFQRYATLLAENDITMLIASINSRISSLISASDDRTKKAAEDYINNIKKGKLGVIASSAFLDGIKVQPTASSGMGNQITQLIELQQYLKAGWYNDLGLQANYNMKRETINSNEAQLNEDMLLPFVSDMLRCRKMSLGRVNEMYGTNISVELFGAWADLQPDAEAEGEEEEQDLEEIEEKEEDVDDSDTEE